MASSSFRPTTPFHQSTNHAYDIPRSKTPGPNRLKRPCSEQMKRSKTPAPYDDEGGPWAQTVNTYAWVEQQATEAQRHLMRDGVFTIETRIFDPEWNSGTQEAEQRFWEEQAYNIDIQARMWMLQEEARRIAAIREAERTRLIQEEVQRIQARIHMRREFEKLRLQEERRRAHESTSRKQKAATDKAMAAAWRLYESRWAAITSSTDPLSFRLIPWPVLGLPSSPESIKSEAISVFVLSQAHSTSQTPKERIKEALRRWHPDRFGRLLNRVPENERAMVEEAVGIVARCLNELLSKHSSQAQGRPNCSP